MVFEKSELRKSPIYLISAHICVNLCLFVVNSQTKFFLSALERLPWHDILEIMGKERVKQLLTPEQVAKLRFPEQRQRYERIRKILQGEPVFLSGWDPRHRETYKRSLLSNRWYRFKQAL